MITLFYVILSLLATGILSHRKPHIMKPRGVVTGKRPLPDASTDTCFSDDILYTVGNSVMTTGVNLYCEFLIYESLIFMLLILSNG